MDDLTKAVLFSLIGCGALLFILGVYLLSGFNKHIVFSRLKYLFRFDD